MMYNPTYFPRQRWHFPKDQERNFVAAFFHMATIALTCTSLAQLGWFRLRGSQCEPHLAVYQFFSYGYFDTGTTQTDLQFRAREVVSSPVPVQYHSPSGSKLTSYYNIWKDNHRDITLFVTGDVIACQTKAIVRQAIASPITNNVMSLYKWIHISCIWQERIVWDCCIVRRVKEIRE